jgi:hypothetical protein
MKTPKLLASVLAFSAFALFASTASANLLVNGSFESPDLSEENTGLRRGNDSTPTGGWIVVATSNPTTRNRQLVHDSNFTAYHSTYNGMTGLTGEQYVLLEAREDETYGYAFNLGSLTGALTSTIDIAFWQDTNDAFTRSDKVQYGFFSDPELTTILGTAVTLNLAAENVVANQMFNYGNATYTATGAEGDIYFGFYTTNTGIARERTAFDNAVVIPEPSSAVRWSVPQ